MVFQFWAYFLKLHIFCFRSFILLRIGPFQFVTLDTATYNWPWLNTGSGKCTPTLWNVYPWLLLIVIAKHKFTGNGRPFNVKCNFVSDRGISTRGIMTLCPLFVLVATSVWMTLLPNQVTMSLVPLHIPLVSFICLSNIIGQPTFSHSSWLGILGY